MSTKAVVVTFAAATSLVCGCAATRDPLAIAVTHDSFIVDGQVLKTRESLAGAIRRSGATECRVRPEPTAAYPQVETVLLALQDSGCRPGIVGNEVR